MWPFRRKPHKADEYFRQKFAVSMGREAHRIVFQAYDIRHQYPDLSGPELIRLVYWGASGASSDV